MKRVKKDKFLIALGSKVKALCGTIKQNLPYNCEYPSDIISYMREFRKNVFISKNDTIKSFSLRASTLVQVGDKYLMVLNEGSNKYKHPGGHINLCESLLDGLKRELKEEIGLDIKDADTETIFFDTVFKDGNAMINSLFQIKIDLKTAKGIIDNSPLPTRLFRLEDLNDGNTWQSEIDAIKYYEEKH